MKKEFVMSLSQSYRQDLLNAIQLAEQGMLSPSQQAYCFEEIEDTKGTAFYPANGDELFRKLRTALGEKAQISERQRAEGELHKLGVQLLFHTYIDRFTFAEITHNTAARKYDAIIYLDERVTNEEKRANAAAMRKAFDAWLEEKRCPDEDDSGVAGTQRFLYHREYLFAFGLYFQGFFGRSDAERAWNGFKSGK